MGKLAVLFVQGIPAFARRYPSHRVVNTHPVLKHDLFKTWCRMQSQFCDAMRELNSNYSALFQQAHNMRFRSAVVEGRIQITPESTASAMISSVDNLFMSFSQRLAQRVEGGCDDQSVFFEMNHQVVPDRFSHCVT